MPNDNCYKEWNYCLFKKKRIIPIIMEPTMSNIFLSQDGVIQMYLNNLMFINFSEYNKNEISNLYKTLFKYNVLNKNQKEIAQQISNIVIHNEDPENWLAKAGRYAAEPIDRNEERVKEIQSIAYEHQVDDFLAGILYCSKYEG